MVGFPIGSTFWHHQVFRFFVLVKLLQLLSQLRKHFSCTFSNDLMQKDKEIGSVSFRSTRHWLSRRICSGQLPVTPPPQLPRDRNNLNCLAKPMVLYRNINFRYTNSIISNYFKLVNFSFPIILPHAPLPPQVPMGQNNWNWFKKPNSFLQKRKFRLCKSSYF